VVAVAQRVPAPAAPSCPWQPSISGTPSQRYPGNAQTHAWIQLTSSRICGFIQTWPVFSPALRYLSNPVLRPDRLRETCPTREMPGVGAAAVLSTPVRRVGQGTGGSAPQVVGRPCCRTCRASCAARAAHPGFSALRLVCIESLIRGLWPATWMMGGTGRCGTNCPRNRVQNQCGRPLDTRRRRLVANPRWVRIWPEVFGEGAWADGVVHLSGSQHV
jgi:hypothetical protein